MLAKILSKKPGKNGNSLIFSIYFNFQIGLIQYRDFHHFSKGSRNPPPYVTDSLLHPPIRSMFKIHNQ